MEMVEKVARALCRLDGHPENATMDGKPLWRDYEPEARAAIAAMREPTPEMLEAAERALLGSCYGNSFMDVTSAQAAEVVLRAALSASGLQQTSSKEITAALGEE
jgi:hypothetical protein